MSFDSFYRGKRVLVTGHTGFTGGWLVAWLKLMGARVYGYGLPPSSRPNFFDAALLDRGISSVFADIRDRETLANIFTDFQPEIVFHAVSAGDPQDSVELFGINVAGTVNLLEEARLTGSVRSLVLLTSLPPSNWHPKSQLKHSWLSSTQSVGETAALAFAESFFPGSRIRLGIARFPALIGGGDWRESSLVGKLLLSVLSGDVITPSKSEFQCCHVLEAAHACLQCAEELFVSADTQSIQSFSNSHQAVSYVEFAKKFAGFWGEADLQIEIQAKEPASFGTAADTPAPERTEWTPVLSLDQAISWTVEWYKAFLTDPASAVGTTQSQIERYSELVPVQSAVPTPATTT